LEADVTTFTGSDATINTSGSATVSNGTLTVSGSTTVSREGDNSTSTSTTSKHGLRFTPEYDVSEITVTISTKTSGESTVYITDTSYTTLASASSPGAENSVILSVNLRANTDYFAVVDNGGDLYDAGFYFDNRDLYSYTTDGIDIAGGVDEGQGQKNDQFNTYTISSLEIPVAAGGATIEWEEPSSVSRWETAAFDSDTNGGQLDIYVQTSSDGGTTWSDWDLDGDGSAEPVAPGTDLSAISSADRVRFRADIVGSTPRLHQLSRQWSP